MKKIDSTESYNAKHLASTALLSSDMVAYKLIFHMIKVTGYTFSTQAPLTFGALIDQVKGCDYDLENSGHTWQQG